MDGPVETPDRSALAAHELDFAVPQLLPRPPRSAGLGGTIAVHLALAALFLFVDSLPDAAPPESEIAIGVKNVTTLVAPPRMRDLTLPELMADSSPRPTPAPSAPAPTPKPAVRAIQLPASRPGAPAPELIAEAPALPTNRQQLPDGMIFGTAPPGPPPVIQPVESPKIGFESPASQNNARRTANPTGVVPMPPKTGVEELGRTMARQGSSGGLSVGDVMDSPGGGLRSPSAVQPSQSAVQLLGDTMGVDFKPYLVTVLASVRRNWLAIMPESARMGRRGKVQVQLAIARDGSVPKLVIASGSGAEALDRAAVAGISASNPFPPLPAEFLGQQIRLQFTFAYNMPQ